MDELLTFFDGSIQNSNLAEKVSETYQGIPGSSEPVFFQLALHPIKASYNFFNVEVSVAKNCVYTRQRTNSANTMIC